MSWVNRLNQKPVVITQNTHTATSV